VSRTIKEWQRAAYELAVAKGWHHRECPKCHGFKANPDRPLGSGDCLHCKGTGRVLIDPHSPTRIASRLALIHCEISEAVECVARGRMELWFPARTTKFTDGLPSEPYESDALEGKHTDLARASKLVFMGFKPEGFGIELADVFLRLCDLAESLGVEAEMRALSKRYLPDVSTPEDIAAELYAVHCTIGDWIGDTEDRVVEGGFAQAISECLYMLNRLAVACNVDLLAMAELKHSYNKTRPIRHGGKVL